MSMKCWWVTVYERTLNEETQKNKLTKVFQEQCLSAKRATDSQTECKAKYVGPQYSIFREWY